MFLQKYCDLKVSSFLLDPGFCETLDWEVSATLVQVLSWHLTTFSVSVDGIPSPVLGGGVGEERWGDKCQSIVTSLCHGAK